MSSTRAFVYFVVICGLTLLAYHRTLHGEFQFDDYSFIESRVMEEVSSLEDFLLWARTRIIPTATMLLNMWASGEEPDPFWFHVFNLGVHLLAVFAVFGLATALCDTPRLRGSWLAEQRESFALATAFLFACHPIQIQAVTYITQRAASLTALFYVGSVLLYVRARTRQTSGAPGRPWAAWGGSIGLAAAALLSKETAITLPLAIGLSEAVFFGGKALRSRAFWGCMALGVGVAFVAILTLAPGKHGSLTGADAGWLERQTAKIQYILSRPAEYSGYSSHDYLLTQCTVIPRYFQLILVPRGFNVDHDIPLQDRVSAEVLAGAALVTAVFVFGVWALGRWPVVGFGVLWFFIALSVESSFLPIGDVMNEHRVYLALPGLALASGQIFAWAMREKRAVAVVGGSAVAVALVALTMHRNEVWRTQRSLWTDALSKSPGKARVHVNYGTAVHLDGELEAAIDHYCTALEIEPTNQRAQANINYAQAEQMQRGEAELVVVEQEDGTAIGYPVDPCIAADGEGE